MTRFSFAALVLLAASLSTTQAFVPTHGYCHAAASPAATTTTLYSAAIAESPLSPLTLWGDKISDIKTLQSQSRKAKAPEFAPTISATDLGIKGDATAQLEYVKKNALAIKTKMVDNAAVIFRDFDLMKTQEGFVQFYEAIGMKTCLDPLHSVSARPTVDGKKGSPVYEAVNKESRKNFFIGTLIVAVS